MKIFFLVLILVASLNAQIPDPYSPSTKAFDVISYNAFISFPKVNVENYIESSCTISFNWVENTPSEEKNFVFHLEGLEINSVVDLNGNNYDFTIEQSDEIEIKYYSINLEEAQNISSLVIEYSGDMQAEQFSNWGGVHNDSRGLYAVGVGFRNPYISATRHWLPCFDHPSDKAKFNLVFEVPKGKKVASIGELQKVDLGNTYDTYVWKTELETASYLVSFLVSDFVETNIDDASSPISIYHYDKDQEVIDFAFKNLPDMLSNFEETFDEAYPFEKVGYFLMETPAAMEHQTLVAINQSTVYGYFNQKDTNGSTISHELAHHWFGNLISPTDFRDAWLNESFASFSEAVHLESQSMDKKVFWSKIKEDGAAFLGGISLTEGAIPIYGFDKDESSNYPGTIYRKGSVVLALLRHKLGKEVFEKCIIDYIDKFKFGNVSTSEMKLAFEESSNVDLSSFFNDWIYGKGWPVISYRQYTDGEQSTLIIDQLQSEVWNEYSELWIPISWIDENGNEQDSTFKITPIDNIIKLGNNVPYSDVKVNDSDNMYIPTQLIKSSGIDYEIKDIIRYNQKSSTIEIIDGDLNCPNVRIININGKLIIDEKSCTKKIVTNSFLKGLYLIEIKENGKEYFGKVIVN
ncbi:M1 family aminopeptidase [Candidatus Kapabacteria bacterium]|nr:M1 family aminopeptidase [Candidatus Kapabacteria bacterium]